MSYFERNLLEGEQIQFTTRKHFIIFLTPIVWTAIFVALNYYNSARDYQSMIYVVGAFTLLTWSNEILNYITSRFVITNKRIMMKEGFFIRHTNDTRLATISNVSVNQSLLGQVLGYGTLVIYTFGGEKDLFNSIASPNEFQRNLQIELDKRSP